MTSKAQNKIRVQWMRSGIGFPRRQKQMVRSLGLRRLNQVVERPDTPQIRGLVARIPHLVRIVGEAPKSVLASVPEYTVHPPVPGAVGEKPAEKETPQVVAEAAPTPEAPPAETGAGAGGGEEVAQAAKIEETQEAAAESATEKNAKPAAEPDRKEERPEKAKAPKASKRAKTGKK